MCGLCSPVPDDLDLLDELLPRSLTDAQQRLLAILALSGVAHQGDIPHLAKPAILALSAWPQPRS